MNTPLTQLLAEQEDIPLAEITADMAAQVARTICDETPSAILEVAAFNSAL